MLFIGGTNLGPITGSLPKITGGYGLVCNGSESSPATRWYGYGAFYQETVATRNVGSSGNSTTAHGLAFDASRSSARYSRTDNRIIPDGVALHACIKY